MWGRLNPARRLCVSDTREENFFGEQKLSGGPSVANFSFVGNAQVSGTSPAVVPTFSLGSLAGIALKIDAARGADDILNVLQTEARKLIDHDILLLCLLDGHRAHFTVHALSESGASAILNRTRVSIHEGSPGWVIQHQTQYYGDLSDTPSFSDSIEGLLQQDDMRSVVVVPLRTGQVTMGALVFCSHIPSVYNEREMWIAQILSNEIASALKNTTLMEEARKRISQIELVNQIAEKLSSSLNLSEILDLAVETVRSSFNYLDVSIFLIDHGRHEAVCVAHAGNFSDFVPQEFKHKLSEGIIGWVATHGQRVLANDVLSDQRYKDYMYHPIRSALVLPIASAGDVVGVLNIEDDVINAFDETEALIVQSLCDHLGGAIKNAKVYERVRETNSKLTELDRMKSDFISIVSHDFRSPLASIILAAKSLMKQASRVDHKRLISHLNIIIEQATRLTHLAEDTLSITKMESGKLAYCFKTLNVERLIKDASSSVNFSRRHILEFHVHPDARIVKGDEAKLRQVMQNLLSNAVKYSPHGGRIRVRAERHSDERIIISTSDEGLGIAPEHVNNLFQKFSRVHTEETQDIKGSGLGLWICREIIQSHGGEIWVETEPGKGSRFNFTLMKA